jgi:hypothetical protein
MSGFINGCAWNWSQVTHIDPQRDAEEFNQYLEVLGAVPSPISLNVSSPFEFTYVDPADILLYQWMPYTLPQIVEAKLEDFPDKMKVGVIVQIITQSRM